MTPRSVQIWFQNRRQRLLKPMRQEGDDDESPRDVYATLRSGSGSDASNADGGHQRGLADWSSANSPSGDKIDHARLAAQLAQQQQSLSQANQAKRP